MSERPEAHDSAHLDPRPEFEADEPMLHDPAREAARYASPSQSPIRSRKDELFASQEAVDFEKHTVAEFDNVNIIRSQQPDVLPDVPSYFPSLEQSMRLPELDDHEHK